MVLWRLRIRPEALPNIEKAMYIIGKSLRNRVICIAMSSARAQIVSLGDGSLAIRRRMKGSRVRAKRDPERGHPCRIPEVKSKPSYLFLLKTISQLRTVSLTPGLERTGPFETSL